MGGQGLRRPLLHCRHRPPRRPERTCRPPRRSASHRARAHRGGIRWIGVSNYQLEPMNPGARSWLEWIGLPHTREQEEPMNKPSLVLPSHHATPTSLLDRRGFLIGVGAAGMALGTGIGVAYTQSANAPDYTLRIAPLRLELAPGKVIESFAYNNMVPGPVLRLRE